MCNTALKRKFCGFHEDIFKNCEKCFNEAIFAFFWQVAEMEKGDNLQGIG